LNFISFSAIELKLEKAIHWEGCMEGQEIWSCADGLAVGIGLEGKKI
jgi:hypothetical protein